MISGVLPHFIDGTVVLNGLWFTMQCAHFSNIGLELASADIENGILNIGNMG